MQDGRWTGESEASRQQRQCRVMEARHYQERRSVAVATGASVSAEIPVDDLFPGYDIQEVDLQDAFTRAKHQCPLCVGRKTLVRGVIWKVCLGSEFQWRYLASLPPSIRRRLAIEAVGPGGGVPPLAMAAVADVRHLDLSTVMRPLHRVLLTPALTSLGRTRCGRPALPTAAERREAEAASNLASPAVPPRHGDAQVGAGIRGGAEARNAAMAGADAGREAGAGAEADGQPDNVNNEPEAGFGEREAAAEEPVGPDAVAGAVAEAGAEAHHAPAAAEEDDGEDLGALHDWRLEPFMEPPAVPANEGADDRPATPPVPPAPPLDDPPKVMPSAVQNVVINGVRELRSTDGLEGIEVVAVRYCATLEDVKALRFASFVCLKGAPMLSDVSPLANVRHAQIFH